MTVAQVWFAIWTAICLFFLAICFSARNMKKCLLYLKKKSFFNIEDIYNIIQVLQYKRNLAMQILLLPDHHSAHVPIAWGFLHLAIRRAAGYDACCAFSCIVVPFAWCILSFSEKKSLLLFAINCCDMSVEFQCFNGSHFQAQCALFSAVTIFHNVIFYVRVVKFTQFLFFHAGLFCIYLLSWDTASSI